MKENRKPEYRNQHTSSNVLSVVPMFFSQTRFCNHPPPPWKFYSTPITFIREKFCQKKVSELRFIAKGCSVVRSLVLLVPTVLPTCGSEIPWSETCFFSIDLLFTTPVMPVQLKSVHTIKFRYLYNEFTVTQMPLILYRASLIRCIPVGTYLPYVGKCQTATVYININTNFALSS